jgi:glycosyltransferase involved in cell wall biosynthesis
MNILGIYLLKQARTGGDRRYLELMESLAERGNNVIVIMNTCFEYTPTFFKKLELTIPYNHHGFPPASFLFKKNLKRNIKSIKKQLKNNDGSIDFIHIHGDTHLKGALLLKKLLSAPLFFAFRCNDIDRALILRKNGDLSLGEHLFSLVYEPINRSREKQAARYADLITIQNRHDRDRFIKRTNCPISKTVIIPGNIGLPRCVPEWENKNKSTRVEKIVYIGSLSASKGLWVLLGALGQLIDRGFGFLQCRILGRVENMEPTMEFIKKLGIEENVRIEGFQDPFPYLMECDLMVYPTLYDAYPDTVLEALHTGCPVIATSVGGIPELLHYPELLFESGNHHAVAEKIELCIKNNHFYQKIRLLCAERAETHHFDWTGQFEKAMTDQYKSE